MASRSYHFDGYALDVQARTLQRAGRPVALPLKSFECLAYLVERRERAVGRDELISAVWGRLDVNDALLGQTLARARRAVGDSGEQQNVIRTVPRFGYQWVAAVRAVETDDAPAGPAPGGHAPAGLREDGPPLPSIGGPAGASPVRRPRGRTLAVLALAALLALAAAAVPWLERRGSAPAEEADPAAAGMVLVLPVTVVDADPRSQWLRLGAMEYLSARLRAHDGLPVVPSDRVIAFMAAADRAGPDDPDARLRLARAAGASRLFAATATREAAGWRLDLTVQDAEKTARFEATAATPLEAADRAVSAFLDPDGIEAGARTEAVAPSLRELEQRIDAAFMGGNVQLAAELVESAPPALRGEPSLQVRSAEIDERAGRRELAERHFLKLIEARDDLPAVIHGRALYGLCAIAYRRTALALAQERCEAAQRILADQGDPVLLARAYMLRGSIDEELGRFDAAMVQFGLARLAWRQAGSLQGEATLDVNEGLANLGHGRFPEAIAAFDRATAVLSHFGVLDNLAAALAAKSDAQRALLDIDGALDSSEQAWKLVPRIENASRVRHVGLARAQSLLAAGRLDEAERVIDRFDAAAASAPPEFAVLRARLLSARGRHTEAVAPAEAVLARLAEPGGAAAQLSYATAVFVDAALRDGQVALARRLLARLLAAGPLPPDPSRGFVAALTAGRLALLDGDDTAAEAQLRSALDQALAHQRADEVVGAASLYARFLLDRGRLDEAGEVAGRLAPYADRDYAAALTLADLYDHRGDAAAAAMARDNATRLAQARRALGAVP